jgi:hypothetical protein
VPGGSGGRGAGTDCSAGRPSSANTSGLNTPDQ